MRFGTTLYPFSGQQLRFPLIGGVSKGLIELDHI
jgi:hypothetical protein